jgi:hypothetical protein
MVQSKGIEYNNHIIKRKHVPVLEYRDDSALDVANMNTVAKREIFIAFFGCTRYIMRGHT